MEKDMDNAMWLHHLNIHASILGPRENDGDHAMCSSKKVTCC